MVGVPEKESTGPDEAISTQKTQTLAEKMGENQADTFQVSKLENED